MKIGECMTQAVRLTDPGETLREAARTMAEVDAGFLPVGKDDRLVGIITDRDIAIRGIGAGLGPDAKVSEAMSEEIQYCFEDQDSHEVLENMSEIQVRRLPVLNRLKELVGVISISDLATNGEAAGAGATLGSIAQPSRQHSQAA